VKQWDEPEAAALPVPAAGGLTATRAKWPAAICCGHAAAADAVA